MVPKLSIITAVHNSLAMNRLYWESLEANTTSPFELILVDNHSTDGSEKFFRELAEATRGKPKTVLYVGNERNQSYPASQNQGMRKARADILCFLNNDIWLPKGWNEPFESALEKNPWLALSPSGQEAQPRQSLSRKLKRRWKRMQFLSTVWKKMFSKTEEERLWCALRWMYGDLENFRSPTPVTEKTSMPGLKGDVVIFHRALLEKFPAIWDERVEAADWHLYLSLAEAHERDVSIPLPQVLLNVYVHHFGRYSARQKFEPLQLEKPFLKIEEIWNPEAIDRLWWGNHLPD